MNRLSRAVVPVVVTLDTLVLVVATSTGASPIGGVLLIGGSGHDRGTIPLVVITLILVAIAMANPARKLCSL